MKKVVSFTVLSAALASALFGGFDREQALAAHRHPATAGAIVTCPMFVVEKTLILPRPQSTKVPRNIGWIHVSGVDLHATLTLKSASGNVVSGTPKPLPSGHMQAAVPMEAAFAIPMLNADTRYDVTVREMPPHGAPPNCPNNLPVNLGSFTTEI